MAETAVSGKPESSLLRKVGVYGRKFRRAIEHVVVDKEGPVEISKSFSTLLAVGSTKYERTVAALEIITGLTGRIPAGMLRERYAYKQDLMPFSPEDYALKDKIGFGGVNDVFLLQSNKEGVRSYVLKVNLCEWGSGIKDLLSVAKEQKKEYERISTVYEGIPGLVPGELYLIMHGPSMRRPVSAMIQPFVEGDIRDVFVDFKKDELLDLLQKNRSLACQFAMFAEATRADGSLIENELDLLGMNNLAIVGDGGGERLLLLDPHFRSSRSLFL